MNFTEVLGLINARIGQDLKARDFLRPRPSRWARVRAENVNIIQLQSSTSSDRFCVNLGAHFTFYPYEREEPCDPSKIQESNCLLRRRLTDAHHQGDQWWSLSNENAHYVSGLIISNGMDFFETARLDNIINSCSLMDLETKGLESLGRVPELTAYEFLAYFHEWRGDRVKAARAAETGLRRIDEKRAMDPTVRWGVNLKPVFQRLLSRTSSPLM